MRQPTFPGALLRTILLLSTLLLTVPATAQTGARSADFETSVTDLREGVDSGALAACQRLEKAGAASFGSFYNAGLALRNMGDLPRARAYFEKALLLSPRDLATRRRLRELDSELNVKDKLEALEVRGTPWWTMDEGELLLTLPGLILLGLGLYSRVKGKRPAPTAVLLLGLTGAGTLALVLLTAPAEHRAVVVDQTAQLLPLPQPDKPGDKLPPGLLVNVLERREHYTKIGLADGKVGWLRGAQLEELTLPPAKSASPKKPGAVEQKLTLPKSKSAFQPTAP